MGTPSPGSLCLLLSWPPCRRVIPETGESALSAWKTALPAACHGAGGHMRREKGVPSDGLADAIPQQDETGQ